MRAPARTTTMRTAALAIGVMVAVATVGACTGNGRAHGTSAAGSVADPAKVPAAVAAPGRAAGGEPRGDVAASDDSLELGSTKIRTAQLEVAVKHTASVAAKADAAASIVLGRLARLGTEQSRQVSTTDVTTKVADVDSRVTSAQAAIARLRDLYQHAVKVGDIISIESELSGRESDLESLQAQQRALAAQTAMATITLSLTRAPAKIRTAPATHKHHSGFLGGLQTGWDAFTHGASGIATAAGAALPFAVLLLVLGFLVRLVWPRLRPARPAAPTPAPEAAS
jgi:hypothetical protein